MLWIKCNMKREVDTWYKWKKKGFWENHFVLFCQWLYFGWKRFQSRNEWSTPLIITHNWLLLLLGCWSEWASIWKQIYKKNTRYRISAKRAHLFTLYRYMILNVYYLYMQEEILFFGILLTCSKYSCCSNVLGNH